MGIRDLFRRGRKDREPKPGVTGPGKPVASISQTQGLENSDQKNGGKITDQITDSHRQQCTNEGASERGPLVTQVITTSSDTRYHTSPTASQQPQFTYRRPGTSIVHKRLSPEERRAREIAYFGSNPPPSSSSLRERREKERAERERRSVRNEGGGSGGEI